MHTDRPDLIALAAEGGGAGAAHKGVVRVTIAASVSTRLPLLCKGSALDSDNAFLFVNDTDDKTVEVIEIKFTFE